MIHEGIETLTQFPSNESYSNFLQFMTNDDNILVVDTSKVMCKKIIVRKRIETLSLLSYKDDETLNTKTLNNMLEIHIKTLFNFCKLRALDSDNLEFHDTTVWLVSEDPNNTYEDFKMKYKHLKNTNKDYMSLLPLKVMVKMKNLTEHSKQWYLNSPFTKGSPNDLMASNKYLKVISHLHLIGTTCEPSSETFFHKRNMHAVHSQHPFQSIDEFFDYLF